MGKCVRQLAYNLVVVIEGDLQCLYHTVIIIFSTFTDQVSILGFTCTCTVGGCLYRHRLKLVFLTKRAAWSHSCYMLPQEVTLNKRSSFYIPHRSRITNSANTLSYLDLLHPSWHHLQCWKHYPALSRASSRKVWWACGRWGLSHWKPLEAYTKWEIYTGERERVNISFMTATDSPTFNRK